MGSLQVDIPGSLVDGKNWDSRAPGNCQRKTVNTEHSIKKTKTTQPKKKTQKVLVFFVGFFFFQFIWETDSRFRQMRRIKMFLPYSNKKKTPLK